MVYKEQDTAEAARAWIIRMASGGMTAEDLEAFRQWRSDSAEHNRVFEEERRLWRAAALSPQQDQAVQASWSRMGRRRLIRKSCFFSTALAASIALSFYAPMLKTWAQADRWTGNTVQTLMLADGSEAILDSDTAIALHYSQGQRGVTVLRGNALFKVRHDAARPFTVTAQNGTIRDVGTVFEVRDAEDHVTVSVSQGSVDVQTPQASTARLHEGDRLVYGREKTFTLDHALSPEEIAAWSRGDLMLDGATVRNAISTIARYRRGAVYVWGAVSETRRISGAFRIDHPEDALKTVATIAGLRMTQLPGNILLLRPE